MNASQIRGSLAARDVRPWVMNDEAIRQICANPAHLNRLGINLDERVVGRMMAGIGLDSAMTALITTASISTPVQFLQTWLPGFVETVTAVRNIDELIGFSAVGNWDDEEIVQGILEPVGKSQIYGDQTNVPLASWNVNFERRTVVRSEQGMSVGILEETRAARMNVNSAAEKRSAATLSLEITRNLFGFYGYNAGANRTYGFLNDPALPAYVGFAAGVGGTTWALKTFIEITADIRAMVAGLLTGSKGVVNAFKIPTTLALANAVVPYLTTTNLQGSQSVAAWIAETFPKMRVVSAPELDGANGGANAAYLYADRIEDGSSDGGAVWLQAVPAKFQVLGVQKRVKDYVEDYTNATAGAFLKRPFAVYRGSGN